MKRILTLASLVLAGCDRAAAVELDSRNPAHCLAAFQYAAHWFDIGKRPVKVRAMAARWVYEMERVSASGRSPDEAKAQAKRISESYGDDSKEMDALFLSCGQAQDKDPRFHAELPTLLRAADIAASEQR